MEDRIKNVHVTYEDNYISEGLVDFLKILKSFKKRILSDITKIQTLSSNIQDQSTISQIKEVLISLNVKAKKINEKLDIVDTTTLTGLKELVDLYHEIELEHKRQIHDLNLLNNR